uniref:Uncharacterized protein n=1 Tax=Panagrolaimus superbus TaxID=310955 RepID=A0A914Y711_9BILA
MPQGGSTSKEEANLGKIEVGELKSLHLKDVQEFHAKRTTLFNMSKHTPADRAAAPEPEEDNEAVLQEYVSTYAADPATIRPCFSYSLVSALGWTGFFSHCHKIADDTAATDKMKCKKCNAVYQYLLTIKRGLSDM